MNAPIANRAIYEVRGIFEDFAEEREAPMLGFFGPVKEMKKEYSFFDCKAGYFQFKPQVAKHLIHKYKNSNDGAVGKICLVIGRLCQGRDKRFYVSADTVSHVAIDD